MVRGQETDQITQEGDHSRARRERQRSNHSDEGTHPHRGAAARTPRSPRMHHEMARLQTENRSQAQGDIGPQVAAAEGVGADVEAGVDAEVAAVAEDGTATRAAEEEKGASLGNRAEQLLERCRRA